MNKDQVSGKVDQAVGKVKQTVGEAVGNQNLANKGVAEQVKGAAKETWGDAKDAAKQIHESTRMPPRTKLTKSEVRSASRLNKPKTR